MLSATVMAQSSAEVSVPEVKVILKSSSATRNFYVVDLQQVDESRRGIALHSFYNASTFTVTSSLLEGNRIEISSPGSVSQQAVSAEVRAIIQQSLSAPHERIGKEQMKKFKKQD
jgi:hypothetical protein